MLLENDLIRLRAMEPTDLPLLYRWENDTKLWNNGITLAPYSRSILKEYIANQTDIYQEKQLRLIIEEKDTEQAVGCIDLYDFDPHSLKAAVAILIDEKYQRKGFAKQGIELLTDYAFSLLHLHQLYCYIAEENAISRSLFEKCRFKQIALLPNWIRTTNGYTNVSLYHIERG